MNVPEPDSTEGQLRRSAQLFHDDVLGTVDLDTALAKSRRSSTRPAALVLSALAVVAVVAVVLSLRSGSGDADVAIDEDGLTTTVPDEPVPDFENAPDPIALGSPTDGEDSVGLPVVVEPPTGLTDGQTVSVGGQGFPAGVEVGVVMCTKEAGRDHGARGVEACNIGHVQIGTTDSEGSITLPFVVHRLQTLDGQEIDCASEPGRCIVGIGMISDYDQSGAFAVDFDPSVPLPDPPTLELSSTDGIVDGETVKVVATGLVPNSLASVQQCGEESRCLETEFVEETVDGDGTLRASVRLWRAFGVHGDDGPKNVDCATDACQVIIGGESSGSRAVPPVTVTFDATRGAREKPVLSLLDDGPFAPGEKFLVEVTGVSGNQFVDLSVCPSIQDVCVAHGGAGTSGGQTVVQMTVEPGRGACADGCPIFGAIYSIGDLGPGQSIDPPPLFPEPIMVTITG